MNPYYGLIYALCYVIPLIYRTRWPSGQSRWPLQYKALTLWLSAWVRTPAWKCIKPKTVLKARGNFTVNALSYNQCAPMAWNTARLRPVHPSGLLKSWGCKHHSLVWAPKKNPWDLSRRVGDYPRSRVPAHLCAMDWLKDYGHGYGLEVLKIRLI